MIRRFFSRERDRPPISRLHVGCGPHHAIEGWWNVDIRSFESVDEVMDATLPWPFRDLDYVFAEHFLEHLSLEGAIAMLDHAWESVKPAGTIRLSTPSLEWVLASHFDATEEQLERRIENTLRINRAFHGWGHRFLYSKDLLTRVLECTGWENVRFCEYGYSEDPNLAGLERHGKLLVTDGLPSVWVVEADRASARSEDRLAELRGLLEDTYVRYIRDGH